MTTPTLESKQCRLRPIIREDAEALARHGNNRRIWRGLTDLFPHPYSVEQAHDWIRRCEEPYDDPLRLVIEVDGEACGGIGLRGAGMNEDYVELGYWLSEAYWGKGIATEAVTLVVEYAFRILHANRIEARVFGFNPASARVLEKCGFTLEGRLRKRMFKDGEHTDQLVFGLLPEDRRG